MRMKCKPNIKGNCSNRSKSKADVTANFQKVLSVFAPRKYKGKNKFEVLWFTDFECFGDPECLEFNTEKEAMDFYNSHKEDKDKYHWWVTEREPNSWEVVRDLIV